MIHFLFSKKDLRYLFLKGDDDSDRAMLDELRESLCPIDPICFLPTYKGRERFTQDFMWEYTQPTGTKVWYCAIGLWQYCYKFLKDHNVEFDGLIENKDIFKRDMKHTYEEFKDIVDSWELSLNPREYQLEAAYKVLSYRSSLSQISTRAGKTLIAYMIFRYAMEHLGVKKILVIVPSIDLVKQMYSDFAQYKEFFKAECVWSGGKLVESSNLTIGTFQSLIKFIEKPTSRKPNKKYNPTFFDDYDCLFVDETHRATADQIKAIISTVFMKNLKLGFGLTGTLPKEKTMNYIILHSLLGAKIQDIKPIQLMQSGYISPIDIHQVRIHYSSEKSKEDTKKLFIGCADYALSEFVYENDIMTGKKDKVKLENGKFLIQYKKALPIGLLENKEALGRDDYIKLLQDFIPQSPKTSLLLVEQMMTHFLPQRIDYICNSILPYCTGNTLILGHYVEYIKYVTEIIKQRFPNRKIYMITGSISSKRRDKMMQEMKSDHGYILVASYAIMSTGVTLPLLEHGILMESYKSEIINVQSLGRGLGLGEGKEKYEVYDIIDCFDKKCSSNKIYLQGREKIKIYDENCYKYNVVNVNV